jgi:hypothetical protein
MTPQRNLPVIDADTHVIETERTWDFLEPSGQKFRPRLFSSSDQPDQGYWVIDDKIRGFRFPTFTQQQLREMSDVSGRNMEPPQAARELDDVDFQLRHTKAKRPSATGRREGYSLRISSTNTIFS